MQRYSIPAIQAALDLQDDRPAAAVTVLKPVLQYELGGASQCCLFPAYLRGLAYLRLRQGRQAATEFQKMLDHPGVVGTAIQGVLARVQLGRAQAMMGDKAAARKSYQDFLTLWKDSDAGAGHRREHRDFLIWRME